MNPMNLFIALNSSREIKNPYFMYGNVRFKLNNENKKKIPGTGEQLSAAKLFARSENYEKFRDSIISFQGDFPFGAQEMIELGIAYFGKYPENFNESTAEQIRLGYRIARICLIEKIIREIPYKRKYYYRRMYYKTGEIDDIVSGMISKYGAKKILEDFEIITGNLNLLNSEVDKIPTGMIKERYAGGISIFFNIAYLIKKAIQKHADRETGAC